MVGDSLLVIKIPVEFVELCSGWCDEMDLNEALGGDEFLLEEIAITGELKPRRIRPYNADEDRLMTDQEWQRQLYADLIEDIRFCVWMTELRRDGRVHEFERFEVWAKSQWAALGAAYGLE